VTQTEIWLYCMNTLLSVLYILTPADKMSEVQIFVLRAPMRTQTWSQRMHQRDHGLGGRAQPPSKRDLVWRPIFSSLIGRWYPEWFWAKVLLQISHCPAIHYISKHVTLLPSLQAITFSNTWLYCLR
jgi:hypothetical protein